MPRNSERFSVQYSRPQVEAPALQPGETEFKPRTEPTLSLDKTRVIKLNGKQRAVDKDDAWLADEQQTPTEESDPISFEATELEQINNSEQSYLEAAFKTRERIWEASKGVVETAKGVLSRLVPDQQIGRVSAPDSMRKLLAAAAERASGVLRGALDLAADRLGVVKKEASALEERAEAANERFQEKFDWLYGSGIPEGEDEAGEYAKALEAVDLIYNSGQLDIAPDSTK